MTRSRRSLVATPLVLLTSCLLELPEPAFPCSSDQYCARGYVCDLEEQRCVDVRTLPPPRPLHDGGEPSDGGERPDSGRGDAGEDAGHDAGPTERDAGEPLDGGLGDGGPEDGGLDGGVLDGGARDGGVDAEDAGVDAPPLLHPLKLLCEEGTPCPLTLDADDDGPREALVGVVVTPPARGTLSAFAGLDATYTPGDGVMGEDAFTVRVSDGALESVDVTVHVRVVSRRSCAHLLLSRGAAESGVYTLRPEGPGGPWVDAFCDMERAGGGWALALKADGTKPTFQYASALWTDASLYNPSALALDDTEAKLAAFLHLPLAQVLVQMRDIGGSWAGAESVVLKARAPSLRDLFAAGQPVTTTAGARAWLGLVKNASLQPYCLAEGFNQNPSPATTHARVRIGILGNEQADCATPDSFVGVGGSAAICLEPSTTTGNRSCSGAVPFNANLTASFAAVLVRPDDFSGLDARPSCSAHFAAGRRIDGVYPIDPDGDGVPFPAYCDMTTDGGGWTLLMRAASTSTIHVTDNGAVGAGPCTLESAECKVSTATIDQLLAHAGTQVFAVRPDGAYRPWFVREEGDARWPPNLECSNRAALLSDPQHAWIVTSYRHLAGAELAQDADVGTWDKPGLYYPSPYFPEQAFFGGSPSGMRGVPSSAAWDSGSLVEPLPGTLWVRTSGYEHLGVAASCLAHLALGHEESGVYLVGAEGAARRVYCDMETRGGGWTVLASYSGDDGEDPLITGAARTEGSPFGFGHLNLALADKVALSAAASESLLVRHGGRWLHVDAPLFDAPMLVPGTDGDFAVTVTSDDGASRTASVGWSQFNTAHGGDFGISVREPPFDHHATIYRKLNINCDQLLLYSYSVLGGGVGDGDVGYDVNTALGSWNATHWCEPSEGGRLRFYVAVR